MSPSDPESNPINPELRFGDRRSGDDGNTYEWVQSYPNATNGNERVGGWRAVLPEACPDCGSPLQWRGYQMVQGSGTPNGCTYACGRVAVGTEERFGGVLLEYADDEADTCELRATIAAMRPVVEAAEAWATADSGEPFPHWVDESLTLADAVDAYREAK